MIASILNSSRTKATATNIFLCLEVGVVYCYLSMGVTLEEYLNQHSSPISLQNTFDRLGFEKY